MVRVLFYLQLAAALTVLPWVPELGPQFALWGVVFLGVVVMMSVGAMLAVHGAKSTTTAMTDAWSVRPRDAQRSAEVWTFGAVCFPLAGLASGFTILIALLNRLHLDKPSEGIALIVFCLVWGLLGFLMSRVLAEVVLRLEDSPVLAVISREIGNRVGLTPREIEAAQAVLNGLTYRAAGERLSVSATTVKSHLLSVYQKTGAGNKIELLRWVEAESARLHQKADRQYGEGVRE